MMPPRTTAAHTCRCVRLTGPSHASGETHKREDDRRDPLNDHQAGEQAIRAPVDVVLRLREDLAGSHRAALRFSSGPKSEQPKTRVQVLCAGSWLARSLRTAARPALSPACARAPVMPPLKSSAPRAS